MADITGSGGSTYESKSEAATSDAAYVKLWLDALALADAEEKDWRKKAESTLDIYSGKEALSNTFNILHSNIETLCPALYNSTPVPDVRRRYNDEDPVGKVVSDILERALSFSIDTYDFDETIKFVIRDGEITGRGVPRVRYKPTFGPDGLVAYEEVVCDYVPWRYFRRGPGQTWADVPWVAFGDFLSKEEIEKLAPGVADQIPLNYSAGANGELKKAGAQEQSIFKRGLVWQIWDKEARKVISICPDYTDAVLNTVDDPLGLTGFFPVPRPYLPIISTASLVPIVPYAIYEHLVEELNVITARISKLVRQLRPRGGYGGNADDVKGITEAGDGELIPLTDASMIGQIANGGGLEKFIVWFPMEPTIKALAQLVSQREMVKQTIYEVTGLSDILRGATQASETATAQQIKTQWGSLRIQERQAEVARIIRDLFRMKSEIIAKKFSWETLSSMTGITVPSNAARDQARQMVEQFTQATQQAAQAQQPAPQPPPNADQIKEAAEGPSQEEVEAVLRSDITRVYRIDVESDSTVRGDLTRNQQTMGLFLQGTAQFVASMGPLVQESPEALGPVMEIYAAFARQFKLGKQAEDALAKVTDAARNAPANAAKPDPKAMAEQAKMQVAQQQAQLDIQVATQKHQQDMERLFAEGERDKQKLELERQRFEMQTTRMAMRSSIAASSDTPPQYVEPQPGQMAPGEFQ